MIFFLKRAIMKAMENVEIYQNLINGEKREIFAAFRALLLEYNEKYNLTTILEEKDMAFKHFLDSAMGESFFKKGASVAEIGSGAGFPSIVLKILRPDLSFDLFESVGKNVNFYRWLWINSVFQKCIFITYGRKRAQGIKILEKNTITLPRAPLRE